LRCRDAKLVAAPKPRNTKAEKDACLAGKPAAEVWPDKPAKAAQRTWMRAGPLTGSGVKFSKARATADGKPQTDIVMPSFGNKNRIAIDRRFGFIRKVVVTHGARHDGSQLRQMEKIGARNGGKQIGRIVQRAHRPRAAMYRARRK
jgi:transposase, IS5 family